MLKDPKQFKRKTKLNLTTREVLNLDSQLDHQGSYWNTEDRNIQFQAYYHTVDPYFNFIQNRPQHPKYFKELETGVFQFNQYHSLNNVSTNHNQLHRTCVAPSEKDVIYTSGSGIYSYNMLNGNKERLVKAVGVKSIDYNDNSQLLCGSIEDRLFIYDPLKQNQNKGLIFDKKIMIDAESVNGAVFCDKKGRDIICFGNNYYASHFDVEEQKEKNRIGTLNSVNDTDVNEEFDLVAFAMDNRTIQIKSLKDQDCDIQLNGHYDYNFAVKFLKDYKIATGGQDISTRIWDIRNPRQELTLLDGCHTSISSFCYQKELDILVVGEVYSFIYAFDLSGGIIKRRTMDFFSMISGISLTPSKKSFISTFSNNKPGIGKFDFINKTNN